jgi:hypothetical protein
MYALREMLRLKHQFKQQHQALPRHLKMLMRMQKPYEEGSILLDAPQHDTMDELVKLTRDQEEWQKTANTIYPAND